MKTNYHNFRQPYERVHDELIFDAKVDEIVNIFSDGPKVNFDETDSTLKKIAPFFGARWKQIKS